MLSHTPAVVVTSSATDRQVKRGIWREIRAHYYRSELLRTSFPEPNQIDWSFPGRPDWYGFGFSTKADQAEAGATRVHGQHSQNLLLIFDEATAVDRLIWDAAKGSLTQSHNHWLVLANPTDPASEFASVWRSGRGWNRIQIDALETPNLIHGDGTNPHLITRQWVDEYIGDNGSDHPLVQARVHGRLPDDSVVTLIGYGDLQRAYEREPVSVLPENRPLVTIGVDVARFGDDLSAIYVVRGKEIVYSERYGKQDTVFTANRVMEVARRHGLSEGTARQIAVDDTGVGGGVTDLLRANGWSVRSEDFGARAADPDRFLNRRAELWWKLRDWLNDEACLANLSPAERRRLEADLPGVTYKVEARGSRTVQILEKKSEMKRRLGRSPDNGDALALALADRTRRVAVVADAPPPTARQRARLDWGPKERILSSESARDRWERRNASRWRFRRPY
jgi:hypothetical protein